MGVFDSVSLGGHEQIVYGYDDVSGLKTIIAIHSTTLGPALGGTRFYPYASEQEALEDVLRLSKAMTLKAAAAGLDLGGGKAVIIGDPHKDKSERLFRVYGRTVDSLNGRYITAEDVGTDTKDMDMIRRETPWVTGIPEDEGGSGDPSPATAIGLISAMKAVSRFLWDSEELGGRTVAVQGVGKVGYHLVRYLVEEGARVTASDVYQPALDRVVTEFGVSPVSPDEILFVEADILSPCALGGVLNEETIPRIQAKAICGSANNQLATDADADRLHERGIIYAPDFVVNAGGLINVFDELHGYSRERALRRVRALYDRTLMILKASQERGINPHRAAVALAMERVEEIGALRRMERGGRKQFW